DTGGSIADQEPSAVIVIVRVNASPTFSARRLRSNRCLRSKAVADTKRSPGSAPGGRLAWITSGAVVSLTGGNGRAPSPADTTVTSIGGTVMSPGRNG